MDAVLEWPMTKCDGCGNDLREATPKTSEKSNDESGRLKWTDFCPKCGVGMFVGERVLPSPTAEVLAEREGQAVLTKPSIKALEDADPEHQVTAGKATAGEVSGVPPDERGKALAEENPDPEGQINQEAAVTPPEEKPEPGAVRPPGKGEFFCTKCASNHKEASKIGKRHTKNREA